LRVAFAGTPEFALPALEALRARHEIAGVLTQPDRPSGRGRKLTASPVKHAALAAHLPLAQPHTLKGESARAQLTAWHPEVLVAVAYGLILPREVLQLPRLGCLNIHASLLPRWRGAAPVQRALLAGDRESGVTIMQMDEGLDTGPVLLQRRLAVRGDHTGGSLHEELASLGAAALLEALDGLAAGTLHGRPQPPEGITYAPKIDKAEAHIDWTDDATHIERQVRAFNPRPVAETALGGERLRVYGAHALTGAALPPENATAATRNVHENDDKISEPGTIVAVREDSMIVRCGRGYLAITEVQRPGRRPVSVRDYSHGLTLSGRRLV
jgi:methionyl-tRNA formyltransferase